MKGRLMQRSKHSDCKMRFFTIVVAVCPLVLSVASTIKEAEFTKLVGAANPVYPDHLLFDCPARSKVSCLGLCALTKCCLCVMYEGNRGTPGRCQGFSTSSLHSGQGASPPGDATSFWGAQLTNVALNQVATQSSTRNDGNASRAVDDMRLRDFDVHLYTEDPVASPSASAALCVHYEGVMGGGVTEELTCANGPIRARYVRVTNTPGKILSLCEVQVMALPAV